MTLTVRIFQAITGLAGLGALTLGLLNWIANINFIGIHMLFGLTVTLALLVLSILMMFIRGMRIWGAAGIVYALIVPVFGLTQATLLVGDFHWLIRIAHLLVGVGAMALAGIMGNQYLRLQARGQTAAQ
ncbi:MAG TPA: hypothetical protein VKR06_28600 [Ktedonosporobacter sp.]|nr:hypothetical protein [Ktedonosporobacter sp.]